MLPGVVRLDVVFRALVTARLAAYDPVSVEDDGTLRRAAVMIVLVPAATYTGGSPASDAAPAWGTGPEAAFLLTGRSARLRAHARQWALPGGRVDGAESPEETARREVAEELGLDIAVTDVLGRLDDYATRSGFAITPVVAWCPDAAGMTPNPDEVDVVEHVPLSDLDHPDAPRFLSIPESDAPVIQMHTAGHWIHAPTAAVLYQFREMVLHGRPTSVAHFEEPVFAWR
jgi:8-oxo-dGTP pyrophosphatase MutT (NUDIX family)